MFSFSAPQFPLMLPHTLTLLLIFFYYVFPNHISILAVPKIFFLGVTLAVSPFWAVLSFLGLRKFSGGKGSFVYSFNLLLPCMAIISGLGLVLSSSKPVPLYFF